MLLDCPGCARSYHVSAADLGDRGRTVVCPRCDAQWHASGPGMGLRTHDFDVVAVSGRPLTATLDEVPAPARWSRLSFEVPRAAIVGLGAAIACASVIALWTGRESVVRTMPRTAAIYAALRLPVNVSGLIFERIAPERLASSDVTIRGAMRNVAGRKVPVPRLTFEVRDAAGSPLVSWSEAAGTKTLSAGRTLAFASSPHRLPLDSRTVLVRFE